MPNLFTLVDSHPMAMWLPNPQIVGGQEVLEGGLLVKWNHKRLTTSPRRIVFSGGVEAIYGPTKITTQTLTIDLEGDQGVGTAEGAVVVTDPDGTFQASLVTFDWKKQTFRAENLDGKAVGFRIRAVQAASEGQKFLGSGVELSSARERPPLVSVRAKKISVQVGERGTAHGADLYLLGSKVLSLPRYSFSLRKRDPGMSLPSISYGREGALGISWASQLQIGPQTAVGAGFRAFPRNPLSAAIGLTQRLDRGIVYGIPGTLDERRSNSYFEDVRVDDPRAAYANAGQGLSAAVGAYLNQTPVARRQTLPYTAPWEIAVEKGWTMGTLRAQTQIRGQQIREEAKPYVQRAIFGGTVLGKPISFGPATLTSRLDGSWFAQPGRDFGYLQSELGLVLGGRRAALAASFSLASSTGSPAFAMDPVFADRMLSLRFDWNQMPSRFSVLAKYDLDSGKWFDHEIRFRQVAGSFEPFIVWRKFPSSFNVGVRFRIDELFDLVQRRRSPSPK